METGRLDPVLIQGIIQAVYRLFRVGTFHSLENDAIDLAIGATLGALRKLDAFESEGITLIFAEDTCIVNGQLLQAPPDVYQSAMDFSDFLSQVHVNSISIGKGVAEADLRALLGLFVNADKASEKLQEGGFLTRHIRLRLVNPNLLLGLEDDRLSLLERVLLTYALAVLVIRRLFQSIEHGGFDLAGYFKRMARQLATVNYADRPVVLDVILAKHLAPDDAKLAVNSAILAVAMTRRFTKHETTLSRVCMAALLLDVGRHRPASKDDETADLSVSTALIHMAMGDLRGDSVERTIVTFEAQRMLLGVGAGEIYPDGVEPTIDAHIIATARQFTEFVSRGQSGTVLSADGAVEVLRQRASSDVAHMTLDLLVDAIGLIPRGAAVELNSGFRGVVLRAGPSPSKYDQPTVRLVLSNRGERVEPASVRLDSDSESAAQHGPVMRVLGNPGPLVRSAQLDIAGPFFEWVSRRKASELNVREWLAEQAKFAESAVNLGRAGRTTASTAVIGGAARKAAMDWDATAAGEAGTTEVMERSLAAAEFEYRRSSAFDGVPDDFAHEDQPQSSIRHRTVRRASETGVRRTVGTGVHRTVQTGSHNVSEFVTRGDTGGTGVRRTVGSGVHRTANTGSQEATDFGPEASIRRSKGSGIYRRVETGSHELAEELEPFARTSSVRRDGGAIGESGAPETVRRVDASDGQPSARRPRNESHGHPTAAEMPPESGAFGRRGTTGSKRTLSPGEPSGSGVLRRGPKSGHHKSLDANTGVPDPNAFDSAGPSGIFRRPTSGTHKMPSGEFETAPVSAAPMTIKEHLEARKRALRDSDSPAAVQSERPTPIASVPRERIAGVGETPPTLPPSARPPVAAQPTDQTAPSPRADTPTAPPLLVHPPANPPGDSESGSTGGFRRTGTGKGFPTSGHPMAPGPAVQTRRPDSFQTPTAPAAAADGPPSSLLDDTE